MVVKTSVTSGHVRPFTQEDIPQVADLHRRGFRTAATSSPELLRSYGKYFSEVFLSPPNCGQATRPLVYCEGRTVTGFLGTVSRPMVWNGERVLASVSSQFIVDPGSRGLAGVELLRTFLNGSQDISIADESNRDSRRLWEALGGATSLAHSMQWLCPLRPFAFGLWAVGKKGRLAASLARIGSPLATVLDAIASGIGANPFPAGSPAVEGEETDAKSFAACLSEFASSRPLHPRYDPTLLGWLLKRADRGGRQGGLKRILVKSKRDRTVGCYIYRLSRHGVSEVLQFFAVKGHVEAVLGHLAYHAAQEGAVVLRGRCEPMLAEALSERHWPCQWGPWVLVHSRRPGLAVDFQRGEACFSRLDGEWCLRFR
jgi:hypothetical protein